MLKRPPSESHLLASAAVSLERALTTDRVSDRIARAVETYLGVTAAEKEAEASKEIPGGMSVKERMEAYMRAVRDTSTPPRAPGMGPGIRERMRAYQEAAKSSPLVTKAEVEASIPVTLATSSADMESPSSIQDRMQAYQEAATSKTSPRSPPSGGSSLMERLAAYQESASSSNIKKQVEVSTILSGAIDADSEKKTE